MEVKVAATSLYWWQPIVPHSSSSQTLPSPISSSSLKSGGCDGGLVCRIVHGSKRSALFGTSSANLLRSRSYDNNLKSKGQILRKAHSDSLDGYSNEEFAAKIQELELKFNFSDEEDKFHYSADANSRRDVDFVQIPDPFPHSRFDSIESPWFQIQLESPEWPERDEIIPASIERKANSVDLPLSLRIIKRKKQWQEGFREAGESAYCSMKAAFSSMVFIIRELHSYSLQMREFLFYEDLQEILVRVQKEMHASFVWLFQQVFSHTPTLMIYVMILLANFTVQSMANNAAIAAPPPLMAATETVSASVNENQQQPEFDSSAIKTFSVSSPVGKTASVGGISGGGGKVPPVGSGTDGGDGSSSWYYRTILPDEISQVSSFGNSRTTEESESATGSESRSIMSEEETKLWNLVVDEASIMKAATRDEALDQEIMKKFVSPVKAEMEPEDFTDYFRTELMYQLAVSQEPHNPLLLANYAQFLYLVVHDHDRAEDYFKRAIRVEPADAEAFSRYATFLWLVRKDINAAEETYLEAIAAEPGNTFHAANYAHFLWNTGGEDTCYPLDTPDNDYNDA